MTTARYATALTGGGVGALDAKATSTLTNGDIAFVLYENVLYIYKFSASSTEPEYIPTVIRPDDYLYQGCWLLQDANIGSINTSRFASKEIVGGDITGAASGNFVATACTCWDKTSQVYLESPGQNNIIWFGSPTFATNHVCLIYLCKKTNGSCEFRTYVLNETTPDDDSDVVAYRFIDFFFATSSSSFREWFTLGGIHVNKVASQHVLSADIGTTYTNSIYYEDCFPMEFVSEIEYGVRDSATTGTILASHNGTNVSFVVGTTVTTATDANLDAWGAAMSQKAGMKPFDHLMYFKSTSGTLDLLAQQFRLKR